MKEEKSKFATGLFAHGEGRKIEEWMEMQKKEGLQNAWIEETPNGLFISMNNQADEGYSEKHRYFTYDCLDELDRWVEEAGSDFEDPTYYSDQKGVLVELSKWDEEEWEEDEDVSVAGVLWKVESVMSSLWWLWLVGLVVFLVLWLVK